MNEKQRDLYISIIFAEICFIGGMLIGLTIL